MTDKQRKILDTLVYFLNRYKQSILKSEQGTGFEELVFDQMIETIKELQEENIRLNELNKPKILKGEESE
jgi:late competence protein required for DNA uptake (superfamily II DNA/RNA helicase)